MPLMSIVAMHSSISLSEYGVYSFRSLSQESASTERRHSLTAFCADSWSGSLLSSADFEFSYAFRLIDPSNS